MKFKLISGLEKCFLDENIEDKYALSEDSVLKNERYSFQAAFSWEQGDPSSCTVKIESPLADAVSVRIVDQVPVRFPVYYDQAPDAYEKYLRVKPGLYPDVLIPYEERNRVNYSPLQLNALFITVDLQNRYPAGVYPITVILTGGDKELCRGTFTLTVLNAVLPKQELLFTEWFHTDCLSVYYHTPVFSEEYWRIVGNFMKNAAGNGINLILTPTFTPALDTAIGHERPTVQLVDVTVRDGKYTFEFSKLGRWVALANAAGIENFEIAHLFTQWGAKATPKVMATVFNADGTSEYKRIFGWDTSSSSEEYRTFLRQYLTELIAYMKALGKDKNCYFHFSDEPGREQLPFYIETKEYLKDILDGYTIMDALSEYEFYESGALSTPIPSSDRVKPFLEHNVPNLWTYYCCVQYRKESNRFIAMPSARNRVIGLQFYKFNIVGFLHWGYNFYFSQHSLYPIDPYAITDSDYVYPAGDSFSVYPAPDGSAYDSLRVCAFYDALQDVRAMKLAETLCGRDAVLNAIDGELPEDKKITFSEYPCDIGYIHGTRAKVNALIAAKL